MRRPPFHPYRALAMAGVDVAVDRLDDPGLMGYYDHGRREVRIARGLLQRERRSTAAHEYVHAVRGDRPACSPWHDDKQERTVRAVAARLLIRLDDLAGALAWSDDPAEVAEELWVDVDTLRDRLSGLEPGERARLAAVLAAREDSG